MVFQQLFSYTAPSTIKMQYTRLTSVGYFFVQKSHKPLLTNTHHHFHLLSPLPPIPFVNLCAIWYHFYNLKKHEKHPWRSVNFSKVVTFSLVKAWNFTKSSTPPWLFLRFLDCTNDTKSHNALHL